MRGEDNMNEDNLYGYIYLIITNALLHFIKRNSVHQK